MAILVPQANSCPPEHQGRYELMTLSTNPGVLPLWLAGATVETYTSYSATIENLLRRAARVYDPAQHTGMFILHIQNGQLKRGIPITFFRRDVPQYEARIADGS